MTGGLICFFNRRSEKLTFLIHLGVIYFYMKFMSSHKTTSMGKSAVKKDMMMMKREMPKGEMKKDERKEERKEPKRK